jgi:hypothetical protein
MWLGLFTAWGVSRQPNFLSGGSELKVNKKKVSSLHNDFAHICIVQNLHSEFELKNQYEDCP